MLRKSVINNLTAFCQPAPALSSITFNVSTAFLLMYGGVAYLAASHPNHAPGGEGSFIAFELAKPDVKWKQATLAPGTKPSSVHAVAPKKHVAAHRAEQVVVSTSVQARTIKPRVADQSPPTNLKEPPEQQLLATNDTGSQLPILTKQEPAARQNATARESSQLSQPNSLQSAEAQQPAQQSQPSKAATTNDSGTPAGGVAPVTAPQHPYVFTNGTLGGSFGAQNLLAMSGQAREVKQLGNIRPYKKQLSVQIAEAMEREHCSANLVAELTIMKNGSLVGTKVLQSSGDESLDQQAVATLTRVDFPPLPNWFTGDKLKVCLNLSSASTIQK